MDGKKIIYLERIIAPDILAGQIIESSEGFVRDVELYFSTPRLWDDYLKAKISHLLVFVANEPQATSAAINVEHYVNLLAKRSINTVYTHQVVQFLFAEDREIRYTPRESDVPCIE